MPHIEDYLSDMNDVLVDIRDDLRAIRNHLEAGSSRPAPAAQEGELSRIARGSAAAAQARGF